MQKLKEISLSRSLKINKIEKLKYVKPINDFYEDLKAFCDGKKIPQEEDINFFLKCFGLFRKDDGSFMLRIRIPAGELSPEGALAIGEISKLYGKNHIDITTRQQIELRFLALEHLYEIMGRLDSVGISSFQTGIDNFRNIVTSSFDGLGEMSIIPTKPLIEQMQTIFLKKEEWIGVLPRKFNTAILGTTINDCNIYGHDCSFVVAKKDSEIGFNLYLGGKVGVQGVDSGLFIATKDVLNVYTAIINLFKEYGFRDNRNKNRLHFLIEAVGLETFIEAIKTVTMLEFKSSGEILCKEELILKDDGTIELDEKSVAIHFVIPSGILSGEDMIELSSLAIATASKIRLSVEQSFYLVTQKDNINEIFSSHLYQKYQIYQTLYFHNQIACVGSTNCSYGVIPTKSEAVALSNYLQKHILIMDGKVRLYWSGCVKGCGIHGVGDIGFEGCKVKSSDGKMVLGVHIFIGGKATKEAIEARILKKSLPLSELHNFMLKLMSFYKNHKKEQESFESFDDRVLSGLSADEILALL